jgi:hypothetical protein
MTGRMTKKRISETSAKHHVSASPRHPQPTHHNRSNPCELRRPHGPSMLNPICKNITNHTSMTLRMTLSAFIMRYARSLLPLLPQVNNHVGHHILPPLLPSIDDSSQHCRRHGSWTRPPTATAPVTRSFDPPLEQGTLCVWWGGTPAHLFLLRLRLHPTIMDLYPHSSHHIKCWGESYVVNVSKHV